MFLRSLEIKPRVKLLQALLGQTVLLYKNGTDQQGNKLYYNKVQVINGMPYRCHAANGIPRFNIAVNITINRCFGSANTVAGNADKVGITVLQATAIIDLQATTSDLVDCNSCIYKTLLLVLSMQLKKSNVPTYRDSYKVSWISCLEV
jgi:hypothetical protein